jgi:hypothetical protein
MEKLFGEQMMQAFLGSVAAAVIVAVIAMFALDGVWRPSDKAYTTSGARITNEGHNLVGKDWYSSRQF